MTPPLGQGAGYPAGPFGRAATVEPMEMHTVLR